MTPDEAMARLIWHADSLDEGAFLAMLRPYRGLHVEVLEDVKAALGACTPKLEGESLPRELVGALWSISRLGRLWALDPGGMLRRNDLISDGDLERLDAFIEDFDLVVESVLGGGDPDGS